MHSQKKTGFTLVEILIVVVIMAVLAATIIPQFSESTKDAKASTVQFNLHTMRAQIELYKSQHDGKLPTGTLVELTSKTDRSGTIGTSNLFPYGPYVRALPMNPFSNSNSVKVITSSPAAAGDVTGTGGWLYNATTGQIFIDNIDHYQD